MNQQLRRAGAGLVLVGLISGVAPVIGFSALQLGIVGYVTALFTLRIALVTLWSTLLLNERPNHWRWAGIGVLIAGAILISR